MGKVDSTIPPANSLFNTLHASHLSSPLGTMNNTTDVDSSMAASTTAMTAERAPDASHEEVASVQLLPPIPPSLSPPQQPSIISTPQDVFLSARSSAAAIDPLRTATQSPLLHNPDADTTGDNQDASVALTERATSTGARDDMQTQQFSESGRNYEKEKIENENAAEEDENVVEAHDTRSVVVTGAEVLHVIPAHVANDFSHNAANIARPSSENEEPCKTDDIGADTPVMSSASGSAHVEPVAIVADTVITSEDPVIRLNRVDMFSSPSFPNANAVIHSGHAPHALSSLTAFPCTDDARSSAIPAGASEIIDHSAMDISNAITSQVSYLKEPIGTTGTNSNDTEAENTPTIPLNSHSLDITVSSTAANVLVLAHQYQQSKNEVASIDEAYAMYQETAVLDSKLFKPSVDPVVTASSILSENLLTSKSPASVTAIFDSQKLIPICVRLPTLAAIPNVADAVLSYSDEPVNAVEESSSRPSSAPPPPVNGPPTPSSSDESSSLTAVASLCSSSEKTLEGSVTLRRDIQGRETETPESAQTILPSSSNAVDNFSSDFLDERASLPFKPVEESLQRAITDALPSNISGTATHIPESTHIEYSVDKLITEDVDSLIICADAERSGSVVVHEGVVQRMFPSVSEADAISCSPTEISSPVITVDSGNADKAIEVGIARSKGELDGDTPTLNTIAVSDMSSPLSTATLGATSEISVQAKASVEEIRLQEAITAEIESSGEDSKQSIVARTRLGQYYLR